MTVGIYLAAVVLANLTVAWFGPWWSVVNAALLIGLDLSLRDRLHESWRGRGLVWKMGLLIASGGLISYLLNRDAGQIALASTVAFVAAALTDAAIYHLLRDRAYAVKVNGSNVPSAAVDSLVFPTLAFGGLNVALTVAQFVAKVAGGFAWGWYLERRRDAALSRQGA